MNQGVEQKILRSTGASGILGSEMIQRLWSGYGSIVRYALEGGTVESVVVKHVSPPNGLNHPRGWNTDLSHERKLKSYAVETAWYQDWAGRCDTSCRVPSCYGIESNECEVVLVLEDLDAAGFSGRRSRVTDAEAHLCLQWLAALHARFMGESPVGLWSTGCYWHLETRSDELQVLLREDPELCACAEAIDAKLKAARFTTLVHGDAKLANFCFSKKEASVAAVDFQYVGRGCGMSDVAYFIGSCYDEAECEAKAPGMLEVYFQALRAELSRAHPAVDADAVEREWRNLYAVAWTDFHRFLKGWSPGHWKVHSYSECLARSVIDQMKEEGLCN